MSKEHRRRAEEVKLSRFPEGADALTKVFYLIKQQTGVNFAQYKHSTLRRRIARRMVLLQRETLGRLCRVYCAQTTNEVELLFNDILINVTSFFRDPAAFATLRKKILPKIIKARGPRGDIRIWVPGCSTGEEVYSVAIVVMETLGNHAGRYRVQIFGTDLSEQIVAKARAGIYPESIAKSVSSTRLRRFFHRTANGDYQISRSIRDMCTFARQNVCEDPPFSHIDLDYLSQRSYLSGTTVAEKVHSRFSLCSQPGRISDARARRKAWVASPTSSRSSTRSTRFILRSSPDFAPRSRLSSHGRATFQQKLP